MHRGNYGNYCQTAFRNERIVRSGVTRHQKANRPYCRPALRNTPINLRNDEQRKLCHANHTNYNNGFQNGMPAIQRSVQMQYPSNIHNYQQYNNSMNVNKSYDSVGTHRQNNNFDFNRNCKNYPNSANAESYCVNRNGAALLPPPPSLRPVLLPQPVPLLPPAIPCMPQNLSNFISKFNGQGRNGAVTARMVPPTFPGLPQVDVHNLMSKLMEYNLINIPKPNRTIEKSPIKVKLPSMIDLNIEKLKIKHKGLIDKLHVGIQCSLCSLTFKPCINPKTGENEGSIRYRIHLQKHYDSRKNPKPSSRPHFKSLKDWLTMDCYNDVTIPMEKLLEYGNTQQSDTTIEPTVASDDSNDDVVDDGLLLKSEVLDPNCFVCQDGFDVVWNDDRDDWCWRDCYKIKDKVFHSTCLSSYKES